MTTRSNYKEAIVLYPSPGAGHLISMIELAKLLIHVDPSLNIHILMTTSPFDPPYNNLPHSGQPPSITFHHLPTISVDRLDRTTSIVAQTLQLLHLNNPNIRKTLAAISSETLITALVIDLFCVSALDIADELDIPCQMFLTTSASCLAQLLHLPTLVKEMSKSFKDMAAGENVFRVPGLPPLAAADMPDPVQDRLSKEYSHFVEYSTKLPKLAGFVVNSFDRLEEKALKAIAEGLLLPQGIATPPVYCIGPLVAWDQTSRNYGNGDKEEYLTWLDSQPPASVVFLCFGSQGFLSTNQLRQIAIGLEITSNQRFLWFIRNKKNINNNNNGDESSSVDSLSTILPEGFLDRTRSRGRVLNTWANQIAILNHVAVGGFVTHCGWNSILEAVCAGVPMIAWPLYAEQRLNKVVLVEEMKVALPLEADVNKDEEGRVLFSGAEVAKKVAELMEPGREEGKVVREKVAAMREEARIAAGEKGTSSAALIKVVDSLKKKKSSQ